MIRNIIPALALSAILFSCNAQTTQGTPFVEASLDAPQQPIVPHSLNVSIGTVCIMAYYPYAEFILSYCGEATVEVDGETSTFDAEVYQIEPGVWVACAANGDYIKVYSSTGTTEVGFSGEQRTFVKQ